MLAIRLADTMTEPQIRESKADRTHELLTACAFLAVFTTVFQLAVGHYVRAGLAAALYVGVIPWLSRRWEPWKVSLLLFIGIVTLTRLS